MDRIELGAKRDVNPMLNRVALPGRPASRLWSVSRERKVILLRNYVMERLRDQMGITE